MKPKKVVEFISVICFTASLWSQLCSYLSVTLPLVSANKQAQECKHTHTRTERHKHTHTHIFANIML